MLALLAYNAVDANWSPYVPSYTRGLLENEESQTRRVVNGGEVLIKETSISRCYATGYIFEQMVGGCIHCREANLTIEDCVFSYNFATYAGAVATYYSTNFLLKRSKLDKNIANNDVGALWVMTSQYANITDTNFTENQAQNCFGAILVNSTNFFIKDCQLVSNAASDVATTYGICNAKDITFSHCYTKCHKDLAKIYVENDLITRSSMAIDTCFFDTGSVENLFVGDCFILIEISGCTCGTASNYEFSPKRTAPGLSILTIGKIQPSIEDQAHCYSFFKTPDPSPMPTPSQSPEPTQSPKQTPSQSPEPTPSQSPSPSPKPTPEQSPSPSPNPTPEQSPSPSPKQTPSKSPEPSPKPSPSASDSPSRTKEPEKQEDMKLPSDLGLGLGLGGGLLLLIIIIIIIICCCCKFCKNTLCCGCCKALCCCCKNTCCKAECCDCHCKRNKGENDSMSYCDGPKRNHFIDFGKIDLPGQEDCVIVLNPMWAGSKRPKIEDV